MPQRANRFSTIFISIVLIDITTKRFAVSALVPYVPKNIVDDILRFTLAYNSGGAMSLSLGPSSRWWFTLLSIGTLFVLAYMYKHTSADDRLQLTSLALICGGAIGNLIYRIRSPRGVVHFIDRGIGAHRFRPCNIADMCVTVCPAALPGTPDVLAAPTSAAARPLALDEPN